MESIGKAGGVADPRPLYKFLLEFNAWAIECSRDADVFYVGRKRGPEGIWWSVTGIVNEVDMFDGSVGEEECCY